MAVDSSVEGTGPSVVEGAKPTASALRRQRLRLLHRLDELTDRPMIALAFAWLVLLILDFTQGLSPGLRIVSNGIWVLFVVDFALEFAIAPAKTAYLRRNWLTAVALLLPAFRLVRAFRALRVLRAARAARSLSLLRLITSLNRGIGALRRTLSRHRVGHAAVLTLVVTFAGAAGMFRFESPAALREAGYSAESALESYGDALWWTAMIMATMGSDAWPRTTEGRVLCLGLSIYAFAIFGYITATIASLFIGRDEPSEIGALRTDIAALRRELAERRGGTAS